MGKINLGRVILGGIVAGLVINVSEFVLNDIVLGADMAASMKSHNLPDVGTSAIAVFTVLAFLIGIATVWVYAAIRPRFGSGAGTAVCAGSVVWFLAYLYPGIGYGMLQLFSTKVIVVGLVWGLVELLIAAVAGAWLYKE